VILQPLRRCGLCWACQIGEDAHCNNSLFPGVSTDGADAEFVRTGERSLLRLPEDLEPVHVAPYADAGLTAFRAVRKAAAILMPGQTAVELGVGGLGHIAVQLLRELTAAVVVAIDASATARKLAADSGADHVLDVDGVIAAVLALRGADVVLDFVGEGEAPAASVAMLKPRGMYLVVGYGGELRLPTFEVALKEISIVGNRVGSFADLSELIRLAQQGRVALRTQRYPLADAPKAIDDLANGRVEGRAVLTM
jgi:NAD+-dependent secondary alcohol dehydrogenase Adh1